jgi:hypothetical protein
VILWVMKKETLQKIDSGYCGPLGYLGWFCFWGQRLECLVVFWVTAICATNSKVSHKSVAWLLFDIWSWNIIFIFLGDG